jgi:diguanylate cyclase (GGDEF)-like protein/PAS domain S-box-containing protein
MSNHREVHSDTSTRFGRTFSERGIPFEDKYLTLVENAPDIIFVVNPDGDFLYINKTAQKITGYSLSELLQKNLLNLVASDYKESLQKVLKDLPHINYHSFLEVEVISSNGGRVPLDIHFKALKDNKGQIFALVGIGRDITERKKFEETLKESEKKYSTLVEKAKDGVVIIQDGICKFANQAVEQFSGYSLDELMGKPLFNKVAPEDRERVSEMYKLRLSDPDRDLPSVYNITMVCKDGSPKELEVSAAVIPYEGRPAVLGIVRDLTERKKMNEALHKSEEKYRLLVENINDVIFILDKEGRFTYISPAIQNYNGLASKELKGQSLLNLVHSQDKLLVSEALKKVLSGDTNPYEFRLAHDEGKTRYVRISCRPLSEANLQAGILGIATDITERKKVIEKLNQAYKEVEDTKTKLKAIIDNAPNVAIQGFNKKGKVLFWNPTSEKLFGFSEKEAKGKTLRDIHFSEEEERKFQAHLKEIFEKKKTSSLNEWLITTKTKEERCLLSSVFPIFLPDQEPIAIALHVDITERKKAEEKINEVKRQIERFSEITADILSIEKEEELFNRIAAAVVDISDFSRVLISYFTDDPPYRKIIGYKGITKTDLNRVRKVEMSREKYLEYFEKGIKIGSQSCYIPYSMKNILDKKAVITSDKPYPKKEGFWHKDDNLLVSMKDRKGKLLGIISVDDSKSGLAPTKETVRPLEIFANLISEIMQRRGLVEHIEESEEKYRELISNIKVGIFRVTPMGKLLEVNPTALEILGYEDGEEIVGLKLVDLFKESGDFEGFMKDIEKQGLVKNKELLLNRKDGTYFWASLTSTAVQDTFGDISFYDTVIEDITERKSLEEKVKHLSVTDELTGLFNRRYFNEHLPEELKTAERWRSTLSLIMIDIDDFKPYNDTYQHLKGDEVLIEAAQVIARNIRKETDWASRFGGDEFTIILPGINVNEATSIAERIKQAFQEINFRPEGEVVHKTLSMGISYCYYKDYAFKHPTDGPKKEYARIATELTNLADRALYEAKNSGKNKVVVSKQSIELSRMQV